MKVTSTEDVRGMRHYILDNGAEVSIELPFEEESGYEFYNALDDDHAEGSLWFDNGVLVDYDGVYGLSDEVYEALRHSGIKVDD